LGPPAQHLASDHLGCCREPDASASPRRTAIEP
jgi:hypothetical protein